ncbi:unnamed protein product [Sphagnum balticum]
MSGVSFCVLLFLVGFTIVALLWWIRFPKAASIVMRGQHVIITGGSSGIGLALAQLVAAEGAAAISLIARDPEKLAAAQASVNAYSADVKDFASVKKAFEAACSESGNVTAVVLSHGVAVPGTFEDTSIETMEHMLDTNLKGNIHAIKAALPFIKSSKSAPASIAIFSSQAGQVGVYGYAAYSASKFALRGLAEVLQQELISRNIRLSLVYPPDTDTPGFAEEEKTKPELTKKISGSSKSMDALAVARNALCGIKAGQFSVHCNFEGLIISTVGAGMSPQPSWSRAVLEVMTMGLLRIVAFFVVRGWYTTILLSQQEKAKK